MKDQKKIGIGITYINFVLNSVISLFLTPFLINSLGDESYSIYKVMQSFAGPLALFNLGISTIVARAIVRFESSDNHNLREKQNTIALAILTSVAMSVLVALVGAVMLLFIPSIYGKNYSSDSIRSGQAIFVFFVLATIFHMLTDAFNGCAVGHERFFFNSALSLLKNVLRVPMMVAVIKMGLGVVAVSFIDFFVAIVIFILSSGFALFILKETPKLTYVSKRELVEMFAFSAAILLQAIINQVNNNLDNMILGAVIIDKSIITMYSSALLIYGVYNSVVSILRSFFIPKAARLLTQKAAGEELTDFVIKPGRYQAIIAVSVVIGFLLLGKEFILIWIGRQYINAYYIVLVLIIPATIPLVENTAISILDASLKRMYRSIVLFVMAAINVAVSIILVRIIGYWGAALGTCASLLIGDVLLMNRYYAKEFDMNIVRLFNTIFKGILPMGVLAGIICFPLTLLGSDSYADFSIKIIVFIMVYGLLLWRWGLLDEEKQYISQSIHILRKGNDESSIG